MRILYVDDEPTIREIVVLSLELRPDFEVRTADSGADAIARLETEAWRPEAILLDVMMPDMDGPTTFQSLRARGLVGDAKVIFITARIMASDRERLMALGAIGVIPKPFDPLRLAGHIVEIMDGARESV